MDCVLVYWLQNPGCWEMSARKQLYLHHTFEFKIVNPHHACMYKLNSRCFSVKDSEDSENMYAKHSVARRVTYTPGVELV